MSDKIVDLTGLKAYHDMVVKPELDKRGTVKTVNGIEPDEAGNVTLTGLPAMPMEFAKPQTHQSENYRYIIREIRNDESGKIFLSSSELILPEDITVTSVSGQSGTSDLLILGSDGQFYNGRSETPINLDLTGVPEGTEFTQFFTLGYTDALLDNKNTIWLVKPTEDNGHQTLTFIKICDKCDNIQSVISRRAE